MKKILIVVDMQNDFVDGALGTKEAVSIIDNACNKINSFNGDIFITLDTHEENYLSTQEGKKLPVPHCIKGTNGWRLNNKIEKSLQGKNFTVIEKATFGSQKLAETIKEKYKDDELSVELIGICTDICVISNALTIRAYNTECEITVDSSCCAGVTPETHSAALEVMKSCLINII
ncbi:MAG: cysteine hydrolase [Clostridia bacterium]|nr:cysteine hydrolase [Clostridia bacterium]